MAYAAIPMGKAHKDLVLRLWGEALYDPRIASVAGERYAWLYERNPMGKAQTWLGLATDTGAIIGCGSVYPRAIRVCATPTRAGVLGDFAVVNAHRVAGCAVAIQRAIVEHRGQSGFPFLMGYPNKTSTPIVKRVGYTVLGESTSYTKPLSTGPMLLGHVQNPTLAQALSNQWVRAAAGQLVDTGLAVLDWARIRVSSDGYRTRIVARADERHDDLWRRCEWQHVMGDKAANALNWRYADHKTEAYRFFCLEERSTGRLVGTVVYATNENKVFIADLLTARLDADVDALLLTFAMEMRRQGQLSIYLNYFGDEALGERLKSLQFFRSEATGRPVVVFLGRELSSEQKAALAHRSRWLMFDGDLDI